MKKIYVLIFAVSVGISASAQTITTSGFSFSPATLNVNVGDQVTFNVAFSSHPVQEVDAATWNANQTTPLSGGFSASSGNSLTVTMSQVGTRFYVCTNHVASSGMKGKIVATSATTGVSNIASVAATAYPNPANNMLHVVSPTGGEIHCTLINMLGQSVLDQTETIGAGSVLHLDISTLDEGNYILSIANPSGQMIRSKVQIIR